MVAYEKQMIIDYIRTKLGRYDNSENKMKI